MEGADFPLNVMRIIAGVHRGRRLLSSTNHTLRPTSDRVREALFSILGLRTSGARVLDLYAGTGAIGIEALSRGAAHVTFVESDQAARRILQMNLDRCQSPDHVQVCTCRVEQFLHRPALWQGPYDIIFADPPYVITYSFLEALRQLSHESMTDDALVVVEHGKKMEAPSTLGALHFDRRYAYGDTCLSLFHYEREPVASS